MVVPGDFPCGFAELFLPEFLQEARVEVARSRASPGGSRQLWHEPTIQPARRCSYRGSEAESNSLTLGLRGGPLE